MVRAAGRASSQPSGVFVRPSKYRCLKYLSIARVLRANLRFSERASALGWTEERIVVIDQDLGHARSFDC